MVISRSQMARQLEPGLGNSKTKKVKKTKNLKTVGKNINSDYYRDLVK